MDGWMYRCMCVCVYVPVCAHVYVCMYVHLFAHVYVCVYGKVCKCDSLTLFPTVCDVRMYKSSPVDSKNIHIEPLYLEMTATHIIVACEDEVIVWPYNKPNTGSNKCMHVCMYVCLVWMYACIYMCICDLDLKKKSAVSHELVFHIDDPPAKILNLYGGGNVGQGTVYICCCMYVCIYVFVCICMYVYIYISICMYV